MPSSRRPARPSGSVHGPGAKATRGTSSQGKGKPRKPSPVTGKGKTSKAAVAKKLSTAKGVTKKPGVAVPKKTPNKATTPAAKTSGNVPSARKPSAPSSGRRPARGASARPTTRNGSSGARGARPASGSGAKRPTQPRRRTAVNASTAPPTRPPRADRKRGSSGLVLPEVLTVRAMVLSVVVLLAVVLLLPTVRAVVSQQSELRELRSELSEQQSQQAELETDLARWDDKSYVIEQARSHLRFVMPGDKVWRVLDADSVPREKPQPGVVEVSSDATEGTETAWYTRIWDSVRIAGNVSTGDQ